MSDLLVPVAPGERYGIVHARAYDHCDKESQQQEPET